jgi:hypothetical protein
MDAFSLKKRLWMHLSVGWSSQIDQETAPGMRQRHTIDHGDFNPDGDGMRRGREY